MKTHRRTYHNRIHSNLFLDSVVTDDRVESIPMLMLANKQDDEHALPIHEIKEMLNPVVSKLSARESMVLPVSALKGEGIETSVDWMYKRLLRNTPSRPPVYR